MGFEFRILLPILDSDFVALHLDRSRYWVTEEHIRDNHSYFLPGSWKDKIWEHRTDEYLNTEMPYFGLKKRGGKSTLELKIQPRHNDISLVEEWIKYKVHIRNRVVLSMKDIINYNEDFYKVFHQNGYDESLWPILLESSGALIPVRKQRKTITLGKVSLEICIIDAQSAPHGKWLSIAVEGANSFDVLEFVRSSREESCPSIWDSAMTLLDFIRSGSSIWVPMPIVSGYPLWLQYLDALTRSSDQVDAKRKVVEEDAMNRLLLLESLLKSGCKENVSTTMFPDKRDHHAEESSAFITTKMTTNVSEADSHPLVPQLQSPAAQDIIYFPKTQFSPRFGDSFFTCSVLSWSYNRDPTVCSFEEVFVRFEVELRMGRRTWTVHRRFSEFVKFHLYVVDKLVCGSSSWSPLPPPHPPKSCYRVLYDRAFLNGRQAALAVYVDELLRALSSNHCMGKDQVREFFSFA